MRDYENILADIEIDLAKTSNENEKLIANIHDKIIVWVVGLATGAIALLFSSINNSTSELFDKTTINITLLLLALTILSGIITRIIDAIIFEGNSALHVLFLTSMHMLRFPDKPRKLACDENVETIEYLLKEDFDADFQIADRINKNYPEYSSDQKDEYARELYAKLVEDKRQEFKNVHGRVIDDIKEIYGYTDSKWEEISKGNKPSKAIRLRFLTKLSQVLFIGSICCFAIAVNWFIGRYIFLQYS